MANVTGRRKGATLVFDESLVLVVVTCALTGAKTPPTIPINSNQRATCMVGSAPMRCFRFVTLI
jgi:hypothetical protein